MGTFGGAHIVTDNLVLWIDAANRSSYSGSATTWRDMSGNNYTGSLINGPTFSPANQGSVVFDGTNDYTTFGNILNFGTSDFTIQFWSYELPGGNIYGKLLSKGYYLQPGWSIQTFNTSLGIEWGNPSKSANYTFPYNTTNVWINGAAVRASGVATVYGNGQPGTSVAMTENLSSTFNLTIANNSLLAEPWAGRFSNLQIYNRALSQAEIKQNYDALKSRYLNQY